MRIQSAARQLVAAPIQLLLALTVFTTTLAGQTPGPSLSLADAISTAQENNPGYQVSQNQLRSAAWDIRMAYNNLIQTSNSLGMSYSTGTQVRVDDVVISERPAQLTSRYQLDLGFTVNGSQLLQPALARANARTTDQNVRRAGANLELNVTQRYIAVLESRAQVQQAQREVDRTGEHVRLAEARFEVGTGMQLDVRRSEYGRGQARVSLLQAQNRAANDVLALSQAMGVPLADDVSLTEQFELFNPGWSADQLIAMANSSSPVLMAGRAQAAAANLQVRSALTSYLPSITLRTGRAGLVQQPIDEDKGFPFDYVRQPVGATVALSWNVFNGIGRERQVEQSRISRQNSQYQLREQEMATEVEIRSALRDLQTAYQSSELQDQNRALAAEELLLAEERFRFGIATSLEVTDAQTRLSDAERAGIASVYAFHRTLAALEASVGQELPR